MARLKSFQVSEIAKDTFVINEAGMSAMYFLRGTQRGLLIDTGVGLTDLKSVISRITDLPYDVVLTHGHQDHIGGAAQFDKIYIHPADAPVLRHIPYDQIADYIEQLGQMGAYDVYDCSPADLHSSEKVPEILDLKEGMIFHLGERDIEVLETPGHTRGGCSFLDRKERILFSGDACNGFLMCLDCSINTLLGALDKIKSYEPEFDRNFNGHVGYAGMPFVMSMPNRILDDCIHICETILDGTAQVRKEKVILGRENYAVFYGMARIAFDPQRRIDPGETPVR
ncbi:MAG TPA: MBL fold metallo-hydrolase [Candidatus Scybalocola faecavium]|nr:MBL fold metallo-hydrolase [Candidatus Scybalocola faecavium]